MGFSFGDFSQICSSAALVVCPLMGTTNGIGIQPSCYARNVELHGLILFQPAVLFIHIIALLMLAIMILHIKSKYTAVGRKEIVLFFYLYTIVTILSFFLDSGIIPSSSTIYPVCISFFFFPSARSSTSILILQTLVVCRSSNWDDLRYILVSTAQWLCRIPICRRRNTP